MSEKKFLRLEKVCDTKYQVVNNRGDYLGQIEYAKGWKKKKMWLFYPESFERGDVWFASGCLKEIAEFMEKLAVQK